MAKRKRKPGTLGNAKARPKYTKAIPQSKHSAQAVNHALWWIESQAKDLETGRLATAEFEGAVRAVQASNIPVTCKYTGKTSKSGTPVFNCFKYPPMDTNPPKRR